MEKYYQKDMECASRDEIRRLQDERLVSQVRHVWDNVPYYRRKMEQAGVCPDDIRGISDLHKLPFLTKDDLRESYPDGLRGVPRKDCVRIHSTSGTTGKRVVAYYTRDDLELWNDCVARALVAADVSADDVVQVC
ncbi:MAG: phenylacetate--CoA ligase, partial [Spirochaetales bacterium]|nr:phenylacetate--CoA ligase [Spirochaetales bacterium]